MPVPQEEHDAVPSANVPTGQVVAVYTQLVEALAALYLPSGHAPQAVALANGFKLGCAMYVPGEQHPKRPVDVKKLFPDKELHWPPHNVRVKPLERNTLK